jgi:hypothetical protein
LLMAKCMAACVFNTVLCLFSLEKCKGKAVPLEAWSGPEGSRKLRFPDFMTNGTGLW